MSTGKQKTLSDAQVVELLEMLPLGQWTPPDLGAWADAFGLVREQGAAAMRRALGLYSINQNGAVALDERCGYAIGRVYVLGREGNPTRVFWMRAATGLKLADVVASARAAFGIHTFVAPPPANPQKLRAAPVLFRPTVARQPAPPAPVPAAAPVVADADADLMRELNECREAVEAASRTLEVERARLRRVNDRWAARVEELSGAMRRLGVVAPADVVARRASVG